MNDIPEPSFDADSVLREIYSQRNSRRVIWTPSTTLDRIGIERYPHVPNTNYQRMKRILRQLCDHGHLVKRLETHSRYTMREIGYSRIEGRELFDPKRQDYTDVDTPVVTVDATFLAHEDGGRKTLPSFSREPWYRPHIVIQDPNARSPKVDENGMSAEDYLGVQFIDSPEKPEFDRSDRYTLRLMYHPSVDYSAVVDGANFTVREGGRIVGCGTVIARSQTTDGNIATEQIGEPERE